MKKTILGLNILLVALCLFLMIRYDWRGGLFLKGATASSFVFLGLFNAIYSWTTKSAHRAFALWMAIGLGVCMAGDIVLNLSFIPGAAIFALGHGFYCLAQGKLIRYRRSDLLFVAVVFVFSLAILLLTPSLHFGSALMAVIVYVYALVISLMVGKSIANFYRQRSWATALMMVGAILFFFSDLMLLLCYFAGAPKITDTLCLYTYFPGQCLLAHAIFHAANQS